MTDNGPGDSRFIDLGFGQTNHAAAASEAAVVGGRVMSQWFVPPIVIPAAFVAFIVALALYRLFVGA